MAQRLNLKISPSKADVRSAGNYALKVSGVSRVKLVKEDRVIEEWVYVIKNLKRPLLGKPTIKKLKLLQFIDSVDDDTIGWEKDKFCDNKIFFYAVIW